MEIPKVEDLLRSLMQGLPPRWYPVLPVCAKTLENNFHAGVRANTGASLILAGRNWGRRAAQGAGTGRGHVFVEELEKRSKSIRVRSPR